MAPLSRHRMFTSGHADCRLTFAHFGCVRVSVWGRLTGLAEH